jgi:hypothetical protein
VGFEEMTIKIGVKLRRALRDRLIDAIEISRALGDYEQVSGLEKMHRMNCEYLKEIDKGVLKKQQ